MKVWAISDLHIDFTRNLDWVTGLSLDEYQEDFLILAGDIVHDVDRMQKTLGLLRDRFSKVFFVPGNHDLWLWKTEDVGDSMEQFHRLLALAKAEEIETKPYRTDSLTIVPLFSWYDFTFGRPSEHLKKRWTDFKACKWSTNLKEVTRTFLQMNEPHLDLKNHCIISFSHFLPFKFLIPDYVSAEVKGMLPVFGSQKLGEQLLRLKPNLHIYGHSHLNRLVRKGDIIYLNNAFGYPYEHRICRRELVCVYDDGLLL